jgi:hypothetical protein
LRIDYLADLLKDLSKVRVNAVGTTCCGKSYAVRSIPGAIDMDALLFTGINGQPPLLNAVERKYACQKPWTEEIGLTMQRWARERVRINPGEPVFGTVLLPADEHIYLNIHDDLLRERVRRRSKSFLEAKAMQLQLIESIRSSGTPFYEIYLG